MGGGGGDGEWIIRVVVGREGILAFWPPPQKLWVRNDAHPKWEQLSDTGMVRDSYPTWAGIFRIDHHLTYRNRLIV